MSNQTGTIIAPVSISDVKSVLGETSNDLAALCKSAKINMWAKYKPVVLNKAFHTDEFDFANNKWLATATWWKGTDGQCGISLGDAKASTYQGLLPLYKGTNNGWVYTPPSGGAASPFRLEDFIGYMSSAVAAVSGFSGTKDGYTDQTIEFSISYTAPGGATISIDDLNISGLKMQDMYFGVYITGPIDLALTAEGTIGNKGTSVSIPGGKFSMGTYQVMPFISTVKKELTDPAQVGDYYTLPDSKIQTLTVTESAITINAQAVKYDMTIGTADCVINIHNMLPTAAVVSYLELQSRITTDKLQPIKMPEHRIVIISNGSESVPARTTKNYTHSIEIPTTADGYTPNKVYIRCLATVDGKSYDSGFAAL